MAVRFIIPGTRVYSSGQQLFPDGSVGAPSIAFKNKSTTGLSLTSSSLLMSVLGFAAFNVASVADGIRIANTYSLGWTPAGANANAPDLRLFRDAANVLAQRNGTNAQEFRLYKTFTDSNNYERLDINAERNSLTYEILATHAGTGNASRNLLIGTAGTGLFVIATGNNDRWYVNSSGHFIGATDNTYDIGASGANRPRRFHIGEYIEGSEQTAPGVAPANGYRLFAEDNGSGKTRLMVIFATGAAQQVAIEP